MTTSLYKLSPSDLTFLWDECPRCFYLKVKLGLERAPTAFPSIFTRIDGLMKDFFEGQSTQTLTPQLPAGVVKFGGKRVQSAPINVPGFNDQVYLSGIFDTVVEFDAGGYGVVDFKTSQPKPEFVGFYGRQLHAYAYALENPAPGKLYLAPITHLGLLVVEPTAMHAFSVAQVAYVGAVTWQPIVLDMAGFLAFLGQVLTVLSGSQPPPAAAKCGWCAYRTASRMHGW